MRSVVALLAVLVPGALGAACGGDDSDTSTPTTTVAGSATGTEAAASEHNDADVTFAQQMIPHHIQALDMADMAVETSKNENVLDLAEQIEAAQQPEIDEMTGWLHTWGEPVEGDEDGHDMGSMGSGGHATGAMMSDAEMDQLASASGAAFDRMWLDMMIRHHQGAIDMAKAHQAEGRNPEALELGRAIIDAQQAEITEMQGIAV